MPVATRPQETTKPRILDLFCGAGGCAKGYQRAGFYVVGVDIKPQPRYCGDEFIQADAMTFPLDGFDCIHASPPCQHYTQLTTRWARRHLHPDLIAATRARLQASGVPYVIENVSSARRWMRDAALLCGSAFGLDVRRHRLFESNILILSPGCNHHWQRPRFRSLDKRRRNMLAPVVGVHGHLNYAGESELRKAAMGIDWMNDQELTQAIPPAYTQFIGGYLMEALCL